jgi:ribosomal protein L24E
MLFIRTDNQQYLFLNKKCKSLYHNRLRPAKLAWTTTYRCATQCAACRRLTAARSQAGCWQGHSSSSSSDCWASCMVQHSSRSGSSRSGSSCKGSSKAGVGSCGLLATADACLQHANVVHAAGAARQTRNGVQQGLDKQRGSSVHDWQAVALAAKQRLFLQQQLLTSAQSA